MSARRKRRSGDRTPREGSGVRCASCGKLAFASRRSARRAVAQMLPGQRMRFYPCGPWWHFTSQDTETVTRHRERDAGSAA